ncbi:methyltransferase domain-containing protein [Aliifodinibius salicampi]|uniref:Methyltransferase domain-containing protein n=1 Tax=Fodinibius salicampi TaxID=1920655 RepID=A0ABT3Q1A1_9BACT|nr:methyltransferase domain-containing protein [Fodinibius salicampi]MCW9713878.1 methyltransferase domain-containing protein [Fodinibius salicampi]
MENLDPVELSRQLKKPTGKTGSKVANKLNESNQKLYELGWKMLETEGLRQVLEIGFGNGRHLSHYFEMNPDVTITGVDFSEEMCEAARSFHPDLIANNRLTIHCADAADMPVPDQSFDLVVGLNIIYFWDPPKPYLNEIARVLKPSGKLLLGYRPRNSVEHLEFTKQNFIHYEPEELNILLSQYDFNIIYEQKNVYEKEAADGNPVEITDACLLAERQ